MTFFWATIAFLLAVVWVITVVDIVRRHLGAKSTTAWLLIVLLVPFVGAILYWVMRKPTPDELQRTVDAQSDVRNEARRRSVDSTRTGI